MLRLILRALIVIWPFLKTAIFRERTIAEVIKENKHLTALQVLILVLILSLVITTVELADYKTELRTLQEQKNKVPAVQCIPDNLEERKIRLINALTEDALV